MTTIIEGLSKKARGTREKYEKRLAETKRNLTALQRDFKDEAEARSTNCRRIKEDIEQ